MHVICLSVCPPCAENKSISSLPCLLFSFLLLLVLPLAQTILCSMLCWYDLPNPLNLHAHSTNSFHPTVFSPATRKLMRSECVAGAGERSTPSSSSCFPIVSPPAAQKQAEAHRVKPRTGSLCLGKKKKKKLTGFSLICFHVSRHVLSCASPTRLLSKNRAVGAYSLFGGVQRSLPGRSRDAPQHTCWSCEQSWERLRSDLAAAAQMQSIFGVESSVNISLCCDCSAFIRLLTPRASVFLRSSGGLHSVQPPPQHHHHLQD